MDIDEDDYASTLGLFSGDCLFHYTSANIGLEKILFGGTFRFSPFVLTNDPREYKRWSFAMRGGGPALGEDLQSKWLKADLLINKYLCQQVKVACFCQNGPHAVPYKDVLELGVSKSRMWSQYGERHQGVCLVFSRKNVLAHLASRFPVEEVLAKDIAYAEGRSISTNARVFEGAEVAAMQVEKFVRHHVTKYQDEILFAKGKDYAQEREFRIALLDTSGPYVEVPAADILTSIILGDRFPNWLAETARKLAERRSIRVGRVNWYNGTLLITRNLENYEGRQETE